MYPVLDIRKSSDQNSRTAENYEPKALNMFHAASGSFLLQQAESSVSSSNTTLSLSSSLATESKACAQVNEWPELFDVEKGLHKNAVIERIRNESTEFRELENVSFDKALKPSSPTEFNPQLPAKAGCRIYRNLRWILFPCYRRLFSTIIFINFGISIFLLLTPRRFTCRSTSNMVAINLVVSVVLRHEHVLNLLFLVFAKVPHRAPLQIRSLAAKFYTFGGVHSGCGVAAVLWYIAYAVLVTQHLFIEPHVNYAIAALTYLILMLFVVILVFAHPSIRSKIHNWFEATHRYAGWMATVLLWIQIILTCRSDAIQLQENLVEALLTSLSFWAIIVITICITYPWLRLRRHRIQAERLSAHAVRLYFPSGHMRSCQSLRISDSPLRETHAFVTLPSAEDSKGFSVIISAAGDWTNRIIRNPPSHLWSKGAPFYGVMRLALLFKTVLLVATGSGIAPCLSLLCHRPKPSCRILWSTPSPIDTYGEPILNMVFESDPQAMIVDTRRLGRPDLVSLAWNSYKASRAEAVFVVSNAKVTKKVIYGLETRGVPAFAPIFDS